LPLSLFSLDLLCMSQGKQPASRPRRRGPYKVRQDKRISARPLGRRQATRERKSA
jgi:hypothetical protein